MALRQCAYLHGAFDTPCGASGRECPPYSSLRNHLIRVYAALACRPYQRTREIPSQQSIGFVQGAATAGILHISMTRGDG